MFIDEYMKELSSEGISEELLMGVGNFDIEAINKLYKKHGFDVDKISKKAMSQKLANLLVFEIDSKFFYDIDVTFVTQEMVEYLLFLNKNPMFNCPEHLWTLDNVKRGMNISNTDPKIFSEKSIARMQKENAIETVCCIWEHKLDIEKMPLNMVELCDYTLQTYPSKSFDWFNHENYNFFSYCSTKAIEDFLSSSHFISTVCTYELDKTLFDAIFKKDEEVSSFFFVTGVENALSIDFERGDYSYLLQNLTDNWHKINPIAQKIIKGMIRNEIEYEKLTEATAKKWNSFLEKTRTNIGS